MKNKKCIFLILGMHRSGTSLTAQILSEMGLYIGDKSEIVQANNANQDGYFENRKVVLLNDDILLENNMVWCCIKSKTTDMITQKSLAIKNIITELYKKSGKHNIAIKDPRICLVEPLWRKEIYKLGIRNKIIVVIRHPYEVAKSLVLRENINLCYALKIWFYYNCCILNRVVDYMAEDILFVNYQDFFLDNKQIKNIVSFCDSSYEVLKEKNIIKPRLHHNFSIDIPFDKNKLYDLVINFYNYLLDISRNKITLKKEDINKYNIYLEEITVTSYTHNKEDMFFQALYHCHNKWIKIWCLNLLQKKGKEFKIYFNGILKNKSIYNIILYGYGTVAKKVLDILDEIRCVGIIDKTFTTDQKTLKNEIKLYNKLPLNIPQNVYVLNTVVNYEDDIFNICCANSIKKKYISFKNIIYSFWEENRINNYNSFDIPI